MSVAERFIERIETACVDGVSTIASAEARGYLTCDDLRHLDGIDFSTIPVCLKAVESAAAGNGRRIRNRDHLIPDVRARRGLHISTAGARPCVYVYGPIGSAYGGVSADDVRNVLAGFSPRETIELHVHSPGGAFHDAVAIHSLISRRPGKVHGFVDGRAASAGSLILMACDTITMATGATMMIHFASLETEGGSLTEEDLSGALTMVQQTNLALLKMYSARWAGTEAELVAALKGETHFSAPEAVAAGLADHISDGVKPAPYAAVSGYGIGSKFSIAASEGPHKHFKVRRASLRLWQMVAAEMREELARD